MPLMAPKFHRKTLPESAIEDISNIPSDTLHVTPEHDDTSGDASPSKAPRSESSLSLRRTISCASIETVRPPSKEGICRRIVEMADHITLGSAKKSSDSNHSSKRKLTRHKRKSTTRLQDWSHNSGKEDTVGTADMLCDDVPSEQDAPSAFLEGVVSSLIHEPWSKGDELCLDYFDHFDYFAPAEINLGEQVAKKDEGTFQSVRTSQIDTKDVVLNIQPSELDVTIWDGLETAHHMFKCRLFLQCTTHPYDNVSLPDIRHIEVNCYTYPAGSRYAQPPALQCTYEDTSSNRISSSDTMPDVNLEAGIEVGKFWRTTMDGEGRWGWYKDASVPVSFRLFEKIEYREFKVVGRVGLGESFVEGELKFGISMLRRDVNMR